MSGVPECLCIMCMPCTHRGQKRALESLELKLKVVVSCHVGDGKNLGPLQKQLVILTSEPSLQLPFSFFEDNGLKLVVLFLC